MSKVAKKETNMEQGTVTFSFADGKSVVASIGKLSKEIIARLALHGLAQKIGDSYAGAENAAEAHASASETLTDLLAGNWSTRAASGAPKISLLAEAVARLRKVPIEKATEVINALMETDEGKEKLKALRSHPQVKATMTTISAERANAKLAEAKKAGVASLDTLLA